MKHVGLALSGVLAAMWLCSCVSRTTRIEQNPEREAGPVLDGRDADVEGTDASADCSCECNAEFEVVACSASGCTCERSDKTNKRIYEATLVCDFEEPCPAAKYVGDPGSDALEGFECFFEALSTPVPGRYFLHHSYFDIGGWSSEYILLVDQDREVIVQRKTTFSGGVAEMRDYDEPQRCSLQGVDACLEALAERSSETDAGGDGYAEQEALCLLPRDFLTDCGPLNESSLGIICSETARFEGR